MKHIQKLFLPVALTFSGIALFQILSGAVGHSGPAVIFFLLFLAFALSRRPSLKGFVYTVMVLASATTALYYPSWFIRWGDFQLAAAITPLIQLIMFGMGTSMSIGDFLGVIRMPKGVLIGVVSHFIIMPLLGFTLAGFSGLEPEIAAGIVLIGCSPNGMASNVISYLAKANLALSVTITAVSTSLAPFVTPLLMKLLAGAFVEINAWHMMLDILKMVILPIGAGLLCNRLFEGKSAWLNRVMPYVSMFGIAATIVIITAAGRENLLRIGPLLIFLVVFHNVTGYLLGYGAARLFGMDERDCRTIAIEVGMQNGGLASGIAREMGKLATVGLAPALFGPVMNITGSILASWWRRRSSDDAATD